MLRADRTVTFAALKPGLLLPPRRSLSHRHGSRWPTSASTSASPTRGWSSRATSPSGCPRAIGRCPQVALGGVGHRRVRRHDGRRPPRRAGRAAQRRRHGAVSTPGYATDPLARWKRCVHMLASHQGWAPEVLADLDRFHSPWWSAPGSAGPTRRRPTCASWSPARRCRSVVDGDGLFALAWNHGRPGGRPARASGDPPCSRRTTASSRCFAARPPGADRVAATRALAADLAASCC